jgi:hypothetical protein
LTLEAEEWRLLQFLQDLCQRDPAINPLVVRRRRRPNQMALIRMRPSPPDYGRTDGDMLARLSELDADYLQDMIKDTQCHDSGAAFSNSLESQFCELAQTVLGVSTDHATAVMGWLRQVLHLEI